MRQSTITYYTSPGRQALIAMSIKSAILFTATYIHCYTSAPPAIWKLNWYRHANHHLPNK